MEQITQWFTNHQDVFIEYGLNILAAFAIFIIGKVIANACSKLAHKAFELRQVDKAVSSFLANIAYSLVFVAAVLMALSQIGVETTSFVAILGAAGLAIGLALKDSLSNFASGVLIITFRPFKSGDYIEAASIAGVVEKIEIFSTTLKSPDNKVIIVPNASITSNPITNYSQQATRRIDMVIGVGYDADLKQAKQVLTEQLEKNEKVLKDPAFTVAVKELGDSSVNFVVRPWVNTADYWPVYFELTENIKLALDEADITIPYPQMDIHIQK